MTAFRMSPDEYFWAYDFRFDLRDATRGEQEAVRTAFLAQRIELDGFTPKHIAVVEMILGRKAIARQSPYVLLIDGEVAEVLGDDAPVTTDAAATQGP